MVVLGTSGHACSVNSAADRPLHVFDCLFLTDVTSMNYCYSHYPKKQAFAWRAINNAVMDEQQEAQVAPSPLGRGGQFLDCFRSKMSCWSSFDVHTRRRAHPKVMAAAVIPNLTQNCRNLQVNVSLCAAAVVHKTPIDSRMSRGWYAPWLTLWITIAASWEVTQSLLPSRGQCR